MNDELEILKEKFTKMGLKLSVHYDRNTIVLSKIEVPKENRSQGLGTNFMNELIHLADRNKNRIVLSPSTDFGASSLNRLKEFYKRFGFVENKGKKRDFEISHSMYRDYK